jgi:FkbM family methyltransferase
MTLPRAMKRLVVGWGQADRLSRLLDRLGAHHLAQRLLPEAAVVEVELPTVGRGDRRRIRMATLAGRDQVARALQAGGWEGFEPPLPSVVAATLRRWPGTFLDVGANTGLYSLIATAADHRAAAIAFEPVPVIAALLRDNLALNEGGARVTVDELAIGDARGVATLHLPVPQPDGTIETSASLEPDFKEDIGATLEVRTCPLDDAWRDHGHPTVTMIKIDVEGSEARVLSGAREVIAAHQPVISVEVLDRVDPAPLEAMRADLGYVDISLSPGEAVVGWPTVQVVPDAPNHLLVPHDRLDAVVEDLRAMGTIRVSAPPR